MKYYIRIFFIAFLSATAYASLQAEIIRVTSCHQDSVQSAINKASDGDTVRVPEGTATWITKASITPAVTINQKAITLLGAGEGRTIIYDSTGNGYLECALYVIGLEGKPFRITGITLYLSTVDCTHGILTVSGNCKNFRIDHCTFDHVTGSGRALSIKGFGLIDHCTIVCPANTTIQSISPAGDGDSSWVRPFALGTKNSLIIEDCYFNNAYMNDNCIDANTGADYVFRYNKVKNTFPGHHGTDSGGEGHRAPHSFEIYHNTLISNISIYTCLRFRDGTGVVFDNTFSGPFGNSITASSYRSCGSYDYWGKCDGTNSFDGNTPGMNGYPCLDQIGWAAIGGIVYQPQKREPLYEWNNRLNSSDLDIEVDGTCPEVALHIQENRDFYNDTFRPRYVPYPYPHPLGLDDASGRLLGLKYIQSDSSVLLQWSRIDSADSYRVICDWQEVSASVTDLFYAVDIPTVKKVYMVYAVRSSDRKVFAAEGVLAGPETRETPSDFSLLQNYPNPFNPSTNIIFKLPSRSFISLKVYDVLGREVATIIHEEMPAGTYSKLWEPTNIASGVYFYRLTAGSCMATKKLVLMK